MDTKLVRGIIVCLLALFPTIAQAQEVEERPRLPGYIAYIGTDYNVYTLNLEDYTETQLTNDAGQTRRYQWPTWSTDGRLAYFGTFVSEGQLATSTYISPDGNTQGELVYTGPELFNYAYWSPGNCEAGERCRDLAVLLSSSARGMLVELVRDGLDEPVNLTAGLGGPPFYYSWSPDGSRMLWQRNNQRFDIYDANRDRVTNTLAQTPGLMLAPAWSPVDDRLLFGARTEDNTTDLVISENDEARVIAEDFAGLVSFNWSPDGNLIAYRERTAQGYGTLFVIDSTSGETVIRSPTTGVISFFWSPDSQRIAYLTLAALPDTFSAYQASHVPAQSQPPSVGIAWSVLEVSTGNVTQYGSFFPTPETLYLVQYFDQFAQSHRVWSPDSRHLLYSELTQDGPVINLLDITQVGSVPISIADGVVGIWSFESMPSDQTPG